MALLDHFVGLRACCIQDLWVLLSLSTDAAGTGVPRPGLYVNICIYIR